MNQTRMAARQTGFMENRGPVGLAGSSGLPNAPPWPCQDFRGWGGIALPARAVSPRSSTNSWLWRSPCSWAAAPLGHRSHGGRLAAGPELLQPGAASRARRRQAACCNRIWPTGRRARRSGNFITLTTGPGPGGPNAPGSDLVVCPAKPIESNCYARIDYFRWIEPRDGADQVTETGALYTIGYARRIGSERLRGELFGGAMSYQLRIDGQ